MPWLPGNCPDTSLPVDKPPPSLLIIGLFQEGRDSVNAFERQPVAAIKRPAHYAFLYLGRRMRRSSWFPKRAGGACTFCHIRCAQLFESCQ